MIEFQNFPITIDYITSKFPIAESKDKLKLVKYTEEKPVWGDYQRYGNRNEERFDSLQEVSEHYQQRWLLLMYSSSSSLSISLVLSVLFRVFRDYKINITSIFPQNLIWERVMGKLLRSWDKERGRRGESNCF